MKRRSLICLSMLIPLVFTVFLLSCEKNYITQVPEEHIPEYHMTYSYVRHSETGPNYVITINTNTHKVIDSVAYSDWDYNNLAYFDGGNKALITDYHSLFVEDVLTHDTLAYSDRDFGGLCISSNEQYCATIITKIFLLSLPNLEIIDSVDNSNLLPIGIDDDKNILYAFYYDSSLVYAIDFSESPSETTVVDIVYWRPNPNRKVSAFLSPDNKTLLVNSEEAYDSNTLFEYATDSLSIVAEIPGQKLYSPVWTNDSKTCYGINDGNVIKYNTQTQIYSTVINKNNIITPDYNWELGDGFYATKLQLTPDNKHLYIQLPPNCGGPCLGFGGHTLVYDLNLQEFVYRYDYSDYLVNGNGIMRLNPKDWSN